MKNWIIPVVQQLKYKYFFITLDCMNKFYYTKVSFKTRSMLLSGIDGSLFQCKEEGVPLSMDNYII